MPPSSTKLVYVSKTRRNFLAIIILFALTTLVFFTHLQSKYPVTSNTNVSLENLLKERKISLKDHLLEEKNTCKNTVQGYLYIADDEGYVCSRKDLIASTGCCPKEVGMQFNCSGCDSDFGCCNTYEFCVSCCMNLEESLLIESALNEKKLRNILTLDEFDICKILCRTSSKSVLHQNQYRSADKYCYLTNAPPLIPPKLAEEDSQPEEEFKKLVILFNKLGYHSHEKTLFILEEN